MSYPWLAGATAVALLGLTTLGIGAEAPAAPRPEMAWGGMGGSIGASIRDVDAADMTREQLPALEGAVVDEVLSGGPAARAGVRAGDVVVEFDGERVRSARQLARLVRETPPGRRVTAEVMRRGQRVALELEVERATWEGLVGHRPMEQLERLGQDLRVALRDFELPVFDIEIRARPGRLGVSVHELNDQLAEYFGVKAGVLVTSVTDQSPAQSAGLQAGDIITGVNGASVEDARDLRRRLAEIEPGQPFEIRIVRDKQPQTLKARLSELTAPRSRRGLMPV